MIQKTSKEVFIPLTVGGGLRSLDDIRVVLEAGADKVAINTAAIKRPELIREASRKFGSSTIVVSIEAIKKTNDFYEAYTDNGRERTGVDVLEWAFRVSELGAGEILITSIDREGTGAGFDFELTRRVAESVPIPVITCGGAGTVDHIFEAFKKGRADAVCVGSLLHYHFIKQFELEDDFTREGNIEFLRKRCNFSRIQDTTISEIKKYLDSHGIECRNQI
jgi:cyclase